MNSRKKTVVLAVVLILVSSLALTACMAALANEGGSEQAIGPDDSIDFAAPDSGKTKSTLESLAEKFAQFNHPGEDGSVTLYSEEQFDSVAAKRAAGERFYLTEEEFDYLVSDTLKIYMEYDRIVLTKAMKLDCFSYINDPAYDTQSFFDKSGLKTAVEGDDVIIYPQHRDGVYYLGEYTGYPELEKEITDIVLYRVEMSDSGLIPGNRVFSLEFVGENDANIADRFVPGRAAGNESWTESGVKHYFRGAALAFDEGSAADAAEYARKLSFGNTQNSGESKPVLFNDSGCRGISFSYNFFLKYTAEGEMISAIDGSEMILPYSHGGYSDLWFYDYNFDREVLGGSDAPRTPLLDSSAYDIKAGDTYGSLVERYGIPYTQYTNVFTQETVGIDMDWSVFTPEGSTIGVNGNLGVKTAYYISADGVLFTMKLGADDQSIPVVTEVTSENLFD